MIAAAQLSSEVPTELHGRRIVITGGLGFIGSNLARSLCDVADVVLVDSLIPEYGGNLRNIRGLEERLRINISDVRDTYALGALLEGTEVLFNLAGQTSHADSMTNPLADLAINAGAQLSILETVRGVCPEATVVFASTRQIYGRPDYLPVDEAHPIRPVDVNGINKAAGEAYHLLYAQVHGLRASSLRLTNTYGPGMRIRDARQTFLGVWIKEALTGGTIRVFGDGRQLRDFTYVDDAVRALMAAAVEPLMVGRAANLGGPEVLDLREVAEILTSLVPGSTFEVVPFPPERARIDIGDYHADAGLAAELLGWRPDIGIRDGLSRTLDYFRDALPDYWSPE